MGRPRVDATPVNVRMPPAELAPLDAWIADQPDPKPSRQEVLRLAFREWMTSLGRLPHRDDPEMAN